MMDKEIDYCCFHEIEHVFVSMSAVYLLASIICNWQNSFAIIYQYVKLIWTFHTIRRLQCVARYSNDILKHIFLNSTIRSSEIVMCLCSFQYIQSKGFQVSRMIVPIKKQSVYCSLCQSIPISKLNVECFHNILMDKQIEIVVNLMR